MLLEKIKMLLFPHKVGIIGSQLVQHNRNHLRIFAGDDLIYVFCKTMESFLLQHISKTAGDQLFFVAQVDTIALLDIGIKAVKIPVT